MKPAQTADCLKFCALTLIILNLLLLPDRAYAAAMVMVQSNSMGGLLVSAGNLYGVTGGEIRLNYMTDSPAVAPNVVVLGNKTQAYLNSSGPNSGTVIINISDRIASNGYITLARVNLVDQDGNPGRIVAPYSARFIKDKGEQEEAPVAISNPLPIPKKPDEDKTAEEKNKLIFDAIKIRQKRPDSRPQETSDVSTPFGASEQTRETVMLVASDSDTPLATPVRVAAPVFKKMTGVLDRFRSYTGEWNPEALKRLFGPLTAAEFLQMPAIVIADGKTPVQVTIRSTLSDAGVNSFIIRGGQVISVLPGVAGKWLLSIVPAQGALKVTVTVESEKNVIEYPVTVAPQLAEFVSGAKIDTPRYLFEFVSKANELALH